MTAPPQMSFDVDCSAEHAFNTWTSGIATWWPADHTVTGRVGITVVMQSGVGSGITDRCEEPPAPVAGHVVGSYPSEAC
jgi:hypothetical protein